MSPCCDVQTLFTLISGTISVTQAYGMGEGWIWAMSYCWWVSVVVAVVVCFLVPFLGYTAHKNVPENLTTALILPIVPTITGQSSWSPCLKKLSVGG